MLAVADGEGISAGMIASALGSSPSNLTHHTSALTASGLVTARRSGNEIRFSIDRDEVAGLGLHLDDLAAQRGVGSDETGLSPADLVKPTR